MSRSLRTACSPNASQPNFAICSQVGQTYKYRCKIWDYLP